MAGVAAVGENADRLLGAGAEMLGAVAAGRAGPAADPREDQPALARLRARGIGADCRYGPDDLVPQGKRQQGAIVGLHNALVAATTHTTLPHQPGAWAHPTKSQ